MTENALKNMILHKQTDIDANRRVIGGWIYTFRDINGWVLSSSFVPEKEVGPTTLKSHKYKHLPDVPVPKRHLVDDGTHCCCRCGSSMVKNMLWIGDFVCTNGDCGYTDTPK